MGNISTLLDRILLIEEPSHGVEEEIDALQQNNLERLKTLVGVCARLSLVDQIHSFSSAGNTQLEQDNFDYHIDRLSAYLTTTCIDVLTGEHYQPYHLWLKKAFEEDVLGDIWEKALIELSQVQGFDEIARAFVLLTYKLYEEGYREASSINLAFKNFVSNRDTWLKHWLLENYIVEELNNDFLPKKRWQDMSDDNKCRNIARYLYALRNLYTHSVNPYQPMEFVQRRNSYLPETSRVRGFFTILFPPSNENNIYRRIMIPYDKWESDLIRLLVITWIRLHWLNITTDNDSFIQKYWRSRIRNELPKRSST